VTHIDLTQDVRDVYGSGARKRLARELRVSPETVKDWLAGRWPASRHRELGEVLLTHIERQEARLEQIKDRARALAGMGK